MRTELPEEEQIKGFELKDIRDFSTKSTLDSEIHEEIILSILTGYKKVDTEKVETRCIASLQVDSTIDSSFALA